MKQLLALILCVLLLGAASVSWGAPAPKENPHSAIGAGNSAPNHPGAASPTPATGSTHNSRDDFQSSSVTWE